MYIFISPSVYVSGGNTFGSEGSLSFLLATTRPAKNVGSYCRARYEKTNCHNNNTTTTTQHEQFHRYPSLLISRR